MPYKSDFPPVEVANEPYPLRLLSAIWEHFSECPERIALINSKNPNNDFVTYGELYLFSLATAAFLQNKGFSRDDVACLVLQNCWEYVPIFLGIGLQGGATSGANPYFTEMNNSFLKEKKDLDGWDRELLHQFNESNAKIVFCSEQSLNNVINAVKSVETVKLIVLVECGYSKKPLIYTENHFPVGVIHFGQIIRTEPLINTKITLMNCNPEKDILLLPFSSGTTGSPKGVLISHQNVGTMLNILIEHFRNYIHSYMRPIFIEKKENELLLLPFFHCYGFCMLQSCLLNGSTGLVMAGFDPILFCETIENFKIRLLKTVPPILVFLAKNPIVSNYDLSSLHVIFSGAAPAGSDLCEEVMYRLPNIQHICQGMKIILVCYGMTELTVASHFPVLDKQRYKSTGKLLSNLEMKIIEINSNNEVEVEKGMPGELFLRGPTIMLGYLNKPEETSKILNSDGWLRTGDVVYVDNEGFIHVLDRLKELIKVNGLQVAPAELEDLLLSHPDIVDCAVIGISDPMAGELPYAFIVPREGGSLTEENVKEFVKAKAVYYKQLKGGVEFIDKIPKSPSGKILRRLLREKLTNKENKLISKI
ncbi:hypothetical protein Mgra_00008698 [Meloidogyne graminicola]|uniref:Uncharacterized protein n=1 Tax=Meloidogyne graminicola TaxID=189291 RepID=A0A8S9ZEX7_9BILA|nr:hypothetical protein Mgra_00008698 [Meloidogyne graminicola]